MGKIITKACSWKHPQPKEAKSDLLNTSKSNEMMRNTFLTKILK